MGNDIKSEKFTQRSRGEPSPLCGSVEVHEGTKITKEEIGVVVCYVILSFYNIAFGQ